MNSLFNKDMSSLEAQTVLFSNIDGKTQEEKEILFNAYKSVLPEIIARETKEGMNLFS